MEHLPAEIQTLYAELLERLMASRVDGSVGNTQGAFTTKLVKGNRYWYFQHLDPGGAKRQTYLGRSEPVLDSVVERLRDARTGASEARAATRRLCSLLRTGGVMGIDAPSARVLRALTEAGVFHLGGVLVGTHAFVAIGTMLGVRWSAAGQRTQDIDVGASRLLVAVPDLQADLPAALEILRMGFLPVPPFDRGSPSTSYSVRGRDLRVDLLTPTRRGGGSRPILIPRLNAAASPLPYLDYLIEECVPTAVPDGDGILISVPMPARFALHKLIVARERPAIFHTRKEKDLRQAAELIRLLAIERPGDLDLAVDGVKNRGRRWLDLARKGLADLIRIDPGISEHLAL
jgi:hypothetical protein